MKSEIIERLKRYVQIDTQSNPESDNTPSTDKQWDLLQLLEQELKDFGLTTELDANGYLFATLESNVTYDLPTVGFLAHVDTSPDFNATNVNPQIIEDYDGQPIKLGHTNRVLSQETFPAMRKVEGHTLMVTDGTSLLGADDKAGVVEIMEALKYLITHPEVKHGRIRVGFTPDEEIGRGPHKFDVERFGAQFAYTVDGSTRGELQYESFNAAGAKITFKGVNVHPGSAKDKMINALNLAIQFHNQLPSDERPEHTEGYEGFFHLHDLNGSVEEATLEYIIRDHDKNTFEARKALMGSIATSIQKEYGEEHVTIDIHDQYYNMGEKIKAYPELIDIPLEVMKSLNIEPIVEPIRGGTDGSQLSYMGLPTPNIFTGGENYHGPYEYVSIDDMEKSVMNIVGILSTFEKRA